jgi:hypothetical protein
MGRDQELLACCQVRRLHLHSRSSHTSAFALRSPATFKYVLQRILFSGFGGLKAPSGMIKISTAGVLRLRATSAVANDRSVKRSAQDDDFVMTFLLAL